MWWRISRGLSLAWCGAFWSAPAAAQSLAISPAPLPVSQPEHSVVGRPQPAAPIDTVQSGQRWYGWKTLSLDAAAIGLGIMSYRTFDGKGSGGALLGSGALSTYAFGAPAVHLLRDQPSRAMASLGLRIGLPVVAVGLVTTSHDGNCASPDEARCQAYRKRLLVTGALSAALVSLIDGAVLAWQPAPKPQRLALTPLAGWDGVRGGLAGVAGTF
jgi:hypothetical protein